ncbi:MAG: long-chain fatty acid--CoA ligase [Proteobacteria bacterium]|nr:long-chain fatty acid--CoA ligase [Pseudomonadota bacterium]
MLFFKNHFLGRSVEMQHSLPFLSFLTGQIALDSAPALSDDASDTWMKYGELREAVQDRLKRLCPPSADLLNPRSLVLCALPQTKAGVVAYLSAVASGHAVLLLDANLPRLDLFLSAYDPDWVLLSSALHPGAVYTLEDWPEEGIFLWRKTTSSEAMPHRDLFLLLRPPGPPEQIKTVRLSYDNVAANLAASLGTLPITKGTRALIQMPLSYSFSLSILHMALSVGGCVVLTEKDIKDRALWTLIQRRDVDLFAGVPFHYEYIAKACIDNLRVPRLKIFLQAGGRMPVERTQELLRQFQARSASLFLLYGQTEAAPRIAILPAHLYPEKLNTVGQVVTGGRIDIAEGGRLIYRGPNVMMGYAEKRSDIALGNSMDGVLDTGDRGGLDKQGFVFIEGKG